MRSTYINSIASALAIAATIAVAPTATAVSILNETFEGYTLGDSDGQGGWANWPGSLTSDIVNTNANGGTQSIAFSTNTANSNNYGSDATLDLAAPITSGQLILSFDLYQPADFDGTAYIQLSRLTRGADKGLKLQGHGTNMTFYNAFGSAPTTTTLLTNQWVNVLVNINLDTDTATASYGGTEIYNGAWSNEGTSLSQFQGINIYANSGSNASTFNIDNLTLDTVVPEPSAVTLLGFGLVGMAFRRRRA